MSKLFRKNQYNAMPDKLLVANTGQVMVLWDVARLRSFAVDLRKTREDIRARYRTGTDAQVAELCEQDVRGYMDAHAASWAHHAEMYQAYLREYRSQVDPRIPDDLDEMCQYLGQFTLDAGAIERAQPEPRQSKLMNIAAIGGMRKAEIAISVAHAALQVTEGSAVKRFLDLVEQVEMMEREAIAKRIKLADQVRAQLVKDGCASDINQIDVTASYVTVEGMPRTYWRLKLKA